MYLSRLTSQSGRRAARALAGAALLVTLGTAPALASEAPGTARQTVKQQREARPDATRPTAQPARPAAKPQRESRAPAPRPAQAFAGISCVPYARLATGMGISGDGRMWWHNAAGLYERGQRPEPGSILAFPGSGGMSRGHVAVVERMVDAREIHIHHANWGGPGLRRGQVMRGVRVIDVSDHNDWTAVRVQVGHDRTNFGRVYRTYGFIHNRPAGMRVAQAPERVHVASAWTPVVSGPVNLSAARR
jgi:hypothetical protein